MFELVKNGYDADAQSVDVYLSNPSAPDRASILVEDDGSGMDWETVTSVWLEPGTDYRERQREAGYLSQKYKRRPLGEKGIGRFAAHKLGSRVTLITRQRDRREVIVDIDWNALASREYLDEVRVKVTERDPVHFIGNRTGTRLEITGLRHEWTRGMVRRLHRSITSICSPFGGPRGFRASLTVTPEADWLEGLSSVETVMEQALFLATCQVDGSQLSYEYEFRPLPGMTQLKARTVRRDDQKMSDPQGSIDIRSVGLGRFSIELRIFDREPQVLAMGVTDKQGLRDFLDESGGVRVYRDGMRVYSYGEPGDDWLQLDAERVNIPTMRVSNNIVVGAVLLESGLSQPLIEKTNREGFVEVDAYLTFVRAVQFAIRAVAAERFQDKARIRALYSKAKQGEPILRSFDQLRSLAQSRNDPQPVLAAVDQAERDYIELRDRLLTAAGSGLSLAVVIHEVEKAVAELRLATEREVEADRIRALSSHLTELVKGLSFLLRRSGARKEKLSTLISQAVFNVEFRLKFHNVEAVVLPGELSDLSVKCTRRLVVATVMNLIDNSIYWLDNKWGGPGEGAGRKRIFIAITKDYDAPTIVVGDNGPGFVDPPEFLGQPFFSRKPDGTGLGLHIAREVMGANRGKLLFPEPGDVTLPKEATGAIVALVFEGEK